MTISSQAVCHHVTRTGREDHVPKESSSVFIGYSTHLDDKTFLAFCKDVKSLAFAMATETVTDELIKSLKLLRPVHLERAISLKLPHSTVQLSWVPRFNHLKRLIELSKVKTLVETGSEDTPTAYYKRWASLMRLKTGLEPYDEVPRDDFLKHFHSIVDPPRIDPQTLSTIQQYLPAVMDAIISFNEDTDYVNNLSPFILSPFCSTRRAAPIEGTSNEIATRAMSDFRLYDINKHLTSEWCQNLFRANPDEFASRVFYGAHVTGVSMDLPPLGAESPTSVIVILLESGGKLRVVAAPNPILQSLSMPIFAYFEQLVRQWRIQGVFSHEKCMKELSDIIKTYQGSKMLDSVDQSNYTDRLPYRSLVRPILEHCVLHGKLTDYDLKIMDVICEGPVQFQNYPGTYHYGTGTPMGTQPSFMLATFANGVLFTIAHLRAHGVKPNDYDRIKRLLINDFRPKSRKVTGNGIPCRIIGDDLASFDNDSFKEYMSLAKGLGMDVQLEKGSHCKHLIEFCSHIITETGVYEEKRLLSRPGLDRSNLLDPKVSWTSKVHEALFYGPDIVLDELPAVDQAELRAAITLFLANIGDYDSPFWESHPAFMVLTDLKREVADIVPLTSLSQEDLRIIYERKRVGWPTSLSFKEICQESTSRVRSRRIKVYDDSKYGYHWEVDSFRDTRKRIHADTFDLIRLELAEDIRRLYKASTKSPEAFAKLDLSTVLDLDSRWSMLCKLDHDLGLHRLSNDAFHHLRDARVATSRYHTNNQVEVDIKLVEVIAQITLQSRQLDNKEDHYDQPRTR